MGTWSEDDNRKLLTEFLDWLGEIKAGASGVTEAGWQALIDQFLAERAPK